LPRERIVDFIYQCRLRSSSGSGECDGNWEHVYDFLERRSAPPCKAQKAAAAGGGAGEHEQQEQPAKGSDGAGSDGEDDVRADGDVDAP